MSQQPRSPAAATAQAAAASSTGVFEYLRGSDTRFNMDPNTIFLAPGPRVYQSNFPSDDRMLARLRADAAREYQQFCENRPPNSGPVVMDPLAHYLLDSSSDEDFDPEYDDGHDWDLRELVKVYKPMRNLVFKGKYTGSRFSLAVIEVDENDPATETFESVAMSLASFNSFTGKVWSGLCTDSFPEKSSYFTPTLFAQAEDFPGAVYTGRMCKFRINHIEVERKWNSPKKYEFGANIYVQCLEVCEG